MTTLPRYDEALAAGDPAEAPEFPYDEYDYDFPTDDADDFDYDDSADDYEYDDVYDYAAEADARADFEAGWRD